jgi:iron complex outermembrane recepter protein
MRRIYPLSLLFLFFLLIANGLGAQGTVRGTVTDQATGETLPGAKVFLASRLAGGEVDEDGNFEFEVAVAPPFEVIVIMFNYDTLRAQVTDLSKPLKLGMQGKMTQAVEIIGRSISEKEAENPLTVESMGSIAIKEVAGADFYASLGNLKGVDLTSASLGFKIINTRGFNSTSPVRSLQVIDGVDNQAPGLNFSLGNFLGASELDLQKVDLVVGAASAFYGPNAFNGVIAMTTKNPFVHQGLSVQGRVGQRNLGEVALRYAKAFKNKNDQDIFAFKVNGSFMRADDWNATNIDPTEQSLVGVSNPGGYDKVNTYGDENLTAGINYAADNSSKRQFPGLGIWHRDGYQEKDIVDYNTYNLKLAAALHFKVLRGAELVAGSNFGTGTTVYQGDNRYSLKDILFLQNKLELKKENKYFVRTYFTQEDAGKSYDAVFTAFLMQNAAKSNNQWSNDYRNFWATNITSRAQSLPGYPQFTQANRPWDDEYAQLDAVMAANQDSLNAWHSQARNFANTGILQNRTLDRFEPGTAAFDSLKNDITSRTAYTEKGTRFFDKSKLWHAQAEYKLTPKFMEVTVGGNVRVYLPYSDGTIFSDTNGVKIVNKEAGAYVGGEKKLFDERLKLNATVRVDKNQNFKFLVSPALSAVYAIKADHILRLALNSAIRNPTLSEQYLYYNVGRAILLGNVNGRSNLVTLESLNTFFDSQNKDSLVYFDVPAIRPEKVKSAEIGYRGTIGEHFFVDASYYFSMYRDFLGFKVGADITVDSINNLANVNQIYRVTANSDNIVTTQGFSIGGNYYFKKYYMLNGNYSWNVLNKLNVDDPIIPAFNTPEHKFNIGFGGRNIPVKLGQKTINDLGFNFNFKYVQGFQFQGSPQFTGFVPTYWLLDGQVNKKVAKIHSTFKLGASNILNRQALQVYGGPYVGRLAYLSVLVELDKL